MPRLPKFKDVPVSPLTGPMNSFTPLDLLSEKQFRYVKNFRVDGAGRLKRAGGLKPLFDDGNYNVGGAIKNNSDLHDQLGSKQNPTNNIREHITMLYEFESGGGSRKLIAATKSRVYALNQRSRNWVLIGDNGGAGYGEGTSADYSTTKFKASQLGNNIVFTNNYNEPLYWYFDSTPDLANKNLLQTIPDLVKLKITKVNYIAEYKGFMFLADLEENTTQQIAKVQWSDYVDATSYYPSTASLSGQQTVGDIGEAIIGMAVLGDHLMIYKERSIWRCSLVSSANLFVFKQIYQGENTPFYTDTLISAGDSHFYMAEAGIYRISVSDIRPVRIDWIHNSSAIIYNKEMISAEDATGPRHVTGGIKSVSIPQSGVIAQVSGCSDNDPVISAHPGNLTINGNPCSIASYTGDATLSVATSSGREPFTYQWQVSLVSAVVGSCTTTNGSNVVISNDQMLCYSDGLIPTSSIIVGGPITGDGIPANTVVSSIIDSTSFTISNNAIAVSGVDVVTSNLTFGTGYVNIPNQNSSSFKINKPTSAEVNNKKYRVNVANEDKPEGVNSNDSTVTLAGQSSAPSFVTIPPSQTVDSGDTVYIEARWCTAATALTWQSKASGGSYANVTYGNQSSGVNNGSHVSRKDGMVAPSGSVAGYYFSRLAIKDIKSSASGAAYRISVINSSGSAATNSTNNTCDTDNTAATEANGKDPKRIQCDSTANIIVGQTVTGSGIPANTTVQSVVDSGSFIISNPVTATANNVTLTFETVITVIAVASSSVDGPSGKETITAGGQLSLRDVHGESRSVLPDETIGYSLKKVGNVIRASSKLDLAKNSRTSAAVGIFTSARSKTVEHKPFTVKATGGTPSYDFQWYSNFDTSGVDINMASPPTPGSGVSITVQPLTTKLKTGSKVKWVNVNAADDPTATLTLTSDSDAGATTITGNLVGTLSNSLVSYRFWDSDTESLISNHKDSTCDITNHTRQCTVTLNSATITCAKDDNILEGMTVTGTGIPSRTTILSVKDPNNNEAPPYSGTGDLTITLSNEATAAGTPTLNFITKTITCDSNSKIKVGDSINGQSSVGIISGSKVATVNSAGSVTSFTVDEFPTIAGNNKLITFTPETAHEYFQKEITTSYENDTSTLSLRVADHDSITFKGVNKVGVETQYRCIVTDSASTPATDISNPFHIKIFSII